jgi:ketosteroid isomerase-like protein
MKLTMLFLPFFMFTIITHAQKSTFDRKIVELEHRWVDVALKGDADAFAAMMSDDYVRMNPDGTVGYKKPWVDAVRSRSTKYHSVNLYDMQVKQHGNTAVVTGKFTQKATKAGVEEEVAGSFMNTWQNVKGKWVIISSSFYWKPIHEDHTRKADSLAIIDLEH